MPLAHSKLTAQGQISVPAEVRKKLGLGPGSVLEWEENEGGELVVRKAGRYTSEEIHDVLFSGETPLANADVKEGIRKHLRHRHARG
jgi:AbrB family looped-hinge helix DNA binding protein